MKIIFKGYDAYGDWISLNGFVRLLLNFYEQIYLITSYHDFVKGLFKDDSRIIIGFNESYINVADEYDEINVEIWEPQTKKFLFTKNSYNSSNRIGTKLGFTVVNVNVFGVVNDIGSFINEDDAKLLENNSSAFYVALGVPKNIKLDFFYYQRDYTLEHELYNKLDLNGTNYIVTNDYSPHNINKKYYENKKYINIHNISKLFDIFKVIENADEVHFIENSIALFVYHLQYKQLLKPVKVFLHGYSRTEKFRKITNLEKTNIFFDMFMCPKLSNWEVILE